MLTLQHRLVEFRLNVGRIDVQNLFGPKAADLFLEQIMKCLSVKPPWSILLFGPKDVENRTWHTHYRGPLLIHSSKTFFKTEMVAAYQRIGEISPTALHSLGPLHHWTKVGSTKNDHLRGVIIGRVDLVGCVLGHESPWYEGEYVMTRKGYRRNFAWIFANQVRFKEPIPIKGAQGLFEVPDDLLSSGCFPS
jgi:hypothetical protein